MQSTSFDEYAKSLSESYPELWRRFYPRVYENVGQYGSPKLAAATHVANASSPLDEHCRKVMYVQGCQLLQLEVPTYFVTRDLLFALSQTDLPPEYELKDFDMRWPAVLFMLPRGMNMDPHGNDCPYLVLSQIKQPEGEFQIELKQSDEMLPMVVARSFGITMTTSSYLQQFGGSITTYTFTVIPEQTPTLRQALELHESESIVSERRAKLDKVIDPNFPDRMTNVPLDLDEGDFAKSCLKLAMKIVLFMDTKKEIVEVGSVKKRFKLKDNRPDIHWPNIVGKSYKIRYVYDKDDQDVPEHQKRHVRFHWRRGHMRKQAYGKGRVERRWIMIEGRFVGTMPEEVGKSSTTQ